MVARALTTWVGALVALVVVFGTTIVQAQDCPNLELKNDNWMNDTAAGFQGGFVGGEIGAAVFQAEPSQYPIRLSSIRLLFGGSEEGVIRDMGIRVWKDNGSAEPGELLFESEFDIQASTNAFSEIGLSAGDITIDEGGVRVGIVFRHNGFPGIARDDDPGSANDFPNRNYIFAQGVGWVQAQLLGVLGDWIIRLCVDPSGGNNSNNPNPNNSTTGGTSNGTTNTSNGTTAPSLLIERIVPSEGTEDNATNITILGTGFDSTASFRIGSTEVGNVVVQSNTAVVGTVPAGISPGVYDLTVTQSGEQFVFNQGFTVKAGDTGGDIECRFPSDCTAGTCMEGMCVAQCATDTDCGWPGSGDFCINSACGVGGGMCVMDTDCPLANATCNKGTCMGGSTPDDGCSVNNVTTHSNRDYLPVALLVLAFGAVVGLRRLH